MPQTKEWTYEEYAALPDDGNRYEIIDGEVCVTPAPATRHQLVIGELYTTIRNYVEGHRLGLVIFGVDLLFVAGNYVSPDLLFIPASELHGVVTRGVESRPTLVIEVLSPQSSRYDRVTKPKWYRKHGVLEYWVVDPVSETIDQYRLEDPENRPLVCEQILQWRAHPTIPPLTIELSALFARAQLPNS